MNDWYKISDVPPRKNTRLLFATRSNNQFVGWIDDKGDYFSDGTENKECVYPSYDISHWQELPKNPRDNEVFTVGYSGGSVVSPMNVFAFNQFFRIHATGHSELVKFVDMLNEKWNEK